MESREQKCKKEKNDNGVFMRPQKVSKLKRKIGKKGGTENLERKKEAYEFPT